MHAVVVDAVQPPAAAVRARVSRFAGDNAPAVFDRLIHKKEMPVVIGVFVMHGRVKAPSDKALDRFNRSYEYDGLGDNYARFLLEELLPEVEKKTTADGRPIRLSKDGNDRCSGGASSGAICAFTAAWERPDQFSRVFSAIGTYVGLRGADIIIAPGGGMHTRTRTRLAETWRCVARARAAENLVYVVVTQNLFTPAA